MAYTELQQTLWMCTPAGVGLCFGVIDYGPEHDLLWIVGDDATGAIVAWPNPQVRLVRNDSLAAPRSKTFKMPNRTE